MPADMITNAFYLVVAMTAVMLVSTQTIRKTKSKSPLQSLDSEDIQKLSRRHEAEKAVHQSPFTPPQDFKSKELTTKRVETTTTTTLATTTVPVVVPKDVVVEQEKQVTNVGSPFSPPPKREWRENSKPSRPVTVINRKESRDSSDKSSPWLDSVEERQRENVDSIPPLAIINLGDSGNNHRRRFKGKPKPTTPQEKGQKDMHDSEPGVTPWTRYTDKPRVKEEVSGSTKANARCGQQRYNPRKQICCQGRVARRHGLSPACCQGEAYDTVFNKCCNGVISVRTNGQADC
uniref:Galaxin-like repeats domain-containing protein n=1 Tax=Arion vulgaris TaxID=1028688 RepID=A0A0B6ZMA8_9EUPU